MVQCPSGPQNESLRNQAFLFMKYFVYILYSEKTGKFYKGSTNDIIDRIKRHNNSEEIATSFGVPWILVWYIRKETRGEAMILEKKLKNLTQLRLISFMKKYNEGINQNEPFIQKLISSSSS